MTSARVSLAFPYAPPPTSGKRENWRATKLTDSLPSFRSVQSSLAVRKFRASGKNAANEATDGCVRTFDA